MKATTKQTSERIASNTVTTRDAAMNGGHSISLWVLIDNVCYTAKGIDKQDCIRAIQSVYNVVITRYTSLNFSYPI